MSIVYLVTGAAGHLGRTVVDELLADGQRVRALVLPGEKNLPDGDVQLFRGDVCSKESLEPFFANTEGADVIVIHCAGIVSIASHYEQIVYDVNVNGTKNIVDMCVLYKVKRLVHVSSVHAIPEKPKGETINEISVFSPDKVVGLYAKTKAEATQYVLDAAHNGLNVCVVQPSGISGPGDYGRGHLTTLVCDFCKRRLTSGVNGGYDFVDVRDVAHGIILCAANGDGGECYILSNKYYKIPQILDMLHDITGVKAIKRILPLWFVKLTAPLAELYYKILKQPPLFTEYSIYTLNSNALFSHEKASERFGYITHDIKETLKDTYSWLKEHKRI